MPLHPSTSGLYRKCLRPLPLPVLCPPCCSPGLSPGRLVRGSLHRTVTRVTALLLKHHARSSMFTAVTRTALGWRPLHPQCLRSERALGAPPCPPLRVPGVHPATRPVSLPPSQAQEWSRGHPGDHAPAGSIDPARAVAEKMGEHGQGVRGRPHCPAAAC